MATASGAAGGQTVKAVAIMRVRGAQIAGRDDRGSLEYLRKE
jgi:hypothetical protein